MLIENLLDAFAHQEELANILDDETSNELDCLGKYKLVTQKSKKYSNLLSAPVKASGLKKLKPRRSSTKNRKSN